ncbi:MAG: efflux RND transporter periplasmic adaptor subunit [Deltaproteobacteria bacterium]
MNTKTGILGFALGVVLAGTTAIVLWPAEPSGHEHEEATLYTCGMHPQVIRDAPGDCPICGMALVPMNAQKKVSNGSTEACTAERALYWRAPMDPSYISDDPGKSPMGMDLVPVCDASGPGEVAVDPRIMQSMGVRTELVRKGPLHRTVRTVARVEANERREVVVTTKIAGWIEKLFVNETGQFVKRGQPLFSIYSPEVVAGQEEYLLAKRQNNDLLVRSARDRLLFWDFTSRQIEQLEARDRPSKALTIFSPTTGFVVHKNAVDGAKVMPDKALFRIVDLSTVWVQADIYEYEVPWLEVGQPAELQLSYVPGRTFSGKVAYIYPYLDESSRTVRVRLEFENPGLLMKPGMFGTVRIQTEAKEEVVLAPSRAIIRTGRRNLAFVDLGDGTYRSTEVTLGDQGDDALVAILDGLRPGQRIVTSSQFLLDSESQLNEALKKMTAPPEAEQPASRPASQPASRPSSQPGDAP